MDKPSDITGLLKAWCGGDQAALPGLMESLYPEMRRIARLHLARRAGHSLESAALANEAYLKLIRAHGLQVDNRTHFLAVCSQIIRRILVDHARHNASLKRGGDADRVTMTDALLGAPTKAIDVLAIDEALSSLAAQDPRKAQVVEMRYFGGLSIEETAEALGISPETAKRDWKFAKAYLLAALSPGGNSL